jgi:uncharacterized protein DUF3572
LSGIIGKLVPISYGKANWPVKQSARFARKEAEALAIQALTFIASDAERLGRFLAVTGIGPSEIRAAAREPGFLGGVLDYIASDERLIVDFASESGLDPADVERGRAMLAGVPWERDVP